jgi:hypothetical protein
MFPFQHEREHPVGLSSPELPGRGLSTTIYQRFPKENFSFNGGGFYAVTLKEQVSPIS